uniref:Uncharacterized conserved protein YibQ, putative polysaccharide deacetylase 2 family n=1 Tax=Candidatus Kentrum sp. SD TaxID=2126332 RepID=A0A450Y5V7_9GAMM|nr:MAG: Uncharacterized conserved protein YibQ, putative polysaccharide deacetylase 2 family [Candidatus Kentron sp. SD]VFK40550.1 MAG: Uncharacterized conserved protein YibQ, putative polysaccharide deacetylase 2 family [Candidatus Kentron sp. SD]
MQHNLYRISALLLITLLPWFATPLGIVPTDKDNPSAKTREQKNSVPPKPSPSITFVPTRAPSHAESAKKHSEKKSDSTRFSHATPLISIVVDDLGYRLTEGIQAVNLPGPITLSIIPHTPHAKRLSDLAHKLGKEILLHMPMEPKANHYLEPDGLTTRMTRAQLTQSVHKSITSLPHAKGINNHMGSLLTRQAKPMRWLMEAILQHDKQLFFLDSRTAANTVAAITARQYGIPTLERDVFLDHEANPNAIRAQFHRMIRKAKAQETALGLAHPYPETLQVLKQLLPQLSDRGVTLVPASLLLAKQMDKAQQSEDTNKPAGPSRTGEPPIQSISDTGNKNEIDHGATPPSPQTTVKLPEEKQSPPNPNPTSR